MADKGVKLVVGLMVAGLMAAFLLPVALGPMTGDDSETVTQDVGETVELKNGLTAEVTATTADTSATYNISAAGDTATPTVNEGENTTVTVDGADVTVSLSEATASNATTTYDYPTTYGWGSGAVALWGIVPVMIILAVFLYFVGMALGRL